MASTSRRKPRTDEEIQRRLLDLSIDDENEDNLLLEEVYDSDEGDTYIPTISSESSEGEEDLDDAERVQMSRAKRQKRSSPPAPSLPQAKRSPEEPIRQICSVLKFSKQIFESNKNYIWSTKTFQPRTSRTLQKNILNIGVVGPKGLARRVNQHEDCFNLFIDDKMLDVVVTHTNEFITEASVTYGTSTATTTMHTCKEEIKALLGVLIFSGSRKANHLNASEMFNPRTGHPFYRTAMSERRFYFLLSCLRFDDRTTRDIRKRTDKLAPIREVWDAFIQNCTDNYNPGEHLTLDEQLLAFRGNCQFRMYIPNKPAKYGIKIMMLCDNKSKYMLNAIPYLGKMLVVPEEARNINLAHYYSKQITKPYFGTNRNVTYDNWFTSVQLAEDLLQNGLTSVGTLRQNKPQVPEELKTKKGRAEGTAGFGFTNKLTLCSYMPAKRKAKKIVLLLSSMHNEPTIATNGKPEIVNFYNKTKGGVDTFDQMCAMYSCSRRTKRWPICIFYGLINAATINAFIIYSWHQENKNEKVGMRRQFMQELALQLIRPWSENRLTQSSLSRDLKKTISTVLNINIPSKTVAPLLDVKRRCVHCTRQEDRKTRMVCYECKKPVCGVHSSPTCLDCM